MATVPLSGTGIALFSGIPFSNDYKHTRWFDNVEEQNSYFNNQTQVHFINSAVFQRGENGQSYVRVNASIDALRSANYLRFKNNHYEDMMFYAFITQLEYKNESVTWVHFKIDVIQTWRFKWSFKPSFVEREHRALYAPDGTPYVNTVDEGLDYGSEYDTVSIKRWVPYKDNVFMVIVSKEVMHEDVNKKGKVEPVTNGAIQPLSIYVHPVKLNGGSPPVTRDGNSVNLTPAKEVLKAMYSNSSAVNNIVSIYLTDYIGKDIGYNESTDYMNFSGTNFQDVAIKNAEGNNTITFYVKDALFYDGKFASFGDKYDDYVSVAESKLLMYPYTVLVLDDFKGNRMEYKNEYINSKTLSVTVKGSMGTGNNVSYSVQQYNSPNISGTDLLRLSQEHSLVNNNPNDIPIVTDLLSAYLQGNKNQIQTQKDSAVFNGIMSVTGSVVGAVGNAVTRNPVGVMASAHEGVAGVGNSMLQMQMINAKQKDISNVPPQMTKMGSNISYDFGNGYAGVHIIKKQIKPEYIKKLTDFFKQFGYKVNELKVPNFHTRAKWNYVKTVSCNIKGSFSNEDLNEIKSVFDNGITLWHIDDVGAYSIDNEVL